VDGRADRRHFGATSRRPGTSAGSSRGLERIWGHPPGEVWLLGTIRRWPSTMAGCVGSLAKPRPCRGSQSVHSAPWREKKRDGEGHPPSVSPTSCPRHASSPQIVIPTRPSLPSRRTRQGRAPGGRRKGHAATAPMCGLSFVRGRREETASRKSNKETCDEKDNLCCSPP
jgi:hypothetical protein